MSKLYEDVIAEYGKKPLKDIKIPAHIKENISKELRFYQIEAIKNYLANKQTLNKNHLRARAYYLTAASNFKVVYSLPQAFNTSAS